ncbi:ATP-binding protein [Streptomyces rubradiris]|nr:ATP-binding protein [Streptomyces rubradiris]
MPYAFEVVIAPDPFRVAQIRRITRATLRYRALPTPLVQDVVLVVSELVTNAIEHGHGTVRLRVRHTGGSLLVEVIDNNPAPARLRTPTAVAERGRGLVLVSVVAQAWGVSRDGKTTWCRFRVPAGRP